MNKLQVGILGYGEMGQRRHRIIKEEFSDIAEVVSISDIDNNKIPSGISGGKADVVFICTPTSGRDVLQIPEAEYYYVEKPVADSLEKAGEMLTKYRGRLKMGTNFLHIPVVECLSNEVALTREDPVFIRAKIGHNGESWIPKSPWRQEMHRGCFLDNGIHVIDLIDRLFGVANSCQANTFNLKWHNIAAEDYAIATYHWIAGMMLNLQVSWCEQDGYCMIEIQYSDHCLVADMRDTSFGLWRVKGREKIAIEIPETSPIYSHYQDMSDFFQIVRNNGHFLGYRDRYLNDMKMIEAAYASKGALVKI